MHTLVVRSAQMLQCMKVLKKLEKENVYILSHRGSEEEISESSGIPLSRILPYNYARAFNILCLKKSFKELSTNNFSSCILIYNNKTGSGYMHVKAIPFIVGARKVQVHFLDGTKKDYSRAGFFVRCLVDMVAEFIDELTAAGLLLFWIIVISPTLYIWFRISGYTKRQHDKQKRVYFFTSQNDTYPSARVRCFGFAKQLTQNGFCCEVFSPQKKDRLCSSGVVKQEQRNAEEMWDTEKILGSIRLFLSLAFRPYAALYIQKAKYNCIAPFMLHIVRKDPLIIDMDDWEFPTKAFRYISCDALFLRIVSKARTLVAASHKLEERMKIFHHNVRLIETGPDTDVFFPNKKAEAASSDNNVCVFGWAGIIFGHPILENIVMALDAFSELCDMPVVMKIAGKGALWEELAEYVKHLDIGNRIELCGWIAPELMPGFMNSIDVGLMPISRSTPFLESKSPTKLFEYMAVGLATISSPLGEIPHIIEHGKNGFLACNREEFVKYMKMLADNSQLRKQIGEKAIYDIRGSHSLHCLGSKLEAAINL